MRLYEVVYILDSALDEASSTSKLEKFHELATAKGGEVSAIDHWGVRQLAYPIDKRETGYYVVAHFTADVDALPEYERLLKLDPEVMRYLLVLNEGEPTTGHSIMAEMPVRVRSEDDEDEEERDEPEAEGEGEGEDETPTNAPPEFSGARGRRRRMEGPRILMLNYKDVGTLSHFVTEQGKILPKRTTKVTAAFQRQLGTAIKRARFLALMPYMRRQDS
ncbi:MAG: 30S ribosomal protein S6 [Gemmatimonadota bacterium]